MKRMLWMTNIDTAIKIYKRADEEGITPQEAFEKILSEKKDDIKFLATTDKDGDLLTGNLRENGYKVLNINEEIRKRGGK